MIITQTTMTVGTLALLILGFIFKSSISLLIRKFFSSIFASAITSKTYEIAFDLRKAFCDFQINYTNFHFNLTQSHLEFKKLYAPLMNNNLNSTDKRKRDDISEKFSNLEKVLHGEYAFVLGSTVKQIKTYFLNSRYSSREPRVYIHICNQDGLLVNLLPKNLNYDSPKNPTDFSIFEEIINTGTPYLDNNIIYTALTNENYKHGGLDLTKIAHKYEHYKLKFWKKRIPQRIKKLFTGKPDLDNNWKSFFKDKNQSVDNSYKSHLAVPITFKAHIEDGNLNKDLIKLLKLDNDRRTILGILVIDHVDTHYFDHHDPLEFENVDVNVMYQFADLISLVIMLHLNFSTGSETYSKYKDSQVQEA